MVYRRSWLAGLAAVGFAFSGLSGLLRPTATGTSWQLIVIAALVLGATITWTTLTYRAHPVLVAGFNLVAMGLAVARIAAPETTRGLLPTGETLRSLGAELDRALSVIRTGIEPVQPLPGIVIIVAIVFWVTGALLAWGLMRGHPYVALIPPLVLALQFATMDRGRTSWLRIAVFLALVGASIVAITTDERDQAAGRMARAGVRPSYRNRAAPAAAALLGVTLLAGILGTAFLDGAVPYDGVLPWRSATGLTADYYGSVSYNPFVGIKQSLVSASDRPVFLARITGDIPASQVYFRLLTMETYNGGQFFADHPVVSSLEQRPWEDSGSRFAGPTGRITTSIQIERLRMDWLPQVYVPDAFTSNDGTERDVRVRRSDGSLRLDGDVTYEGMTYTVESVVPRPEIAVLATEPDGQLSPAFSLAAAADENVPDPVVAAERPEPPDVEAYLALPDSLDPGIAALAREQTRNLDTNFEIGLALESWFHSEAFGYTTQIDTGHAATELAPWLLDPDSPNYHRGYCENFATAMAVMARTLGVPSRVVLGFTPGEPTGEENVVVVRDRNAHAWVELWIPSQGWVRFDPTPRGDGINPATYTTTEAELGFALTSYLDVPDPETLPVTGATLPPPQLPDDFNDKVPDGSGGLTSGSGPLIPSWLTAAAIWLLLAAIVIGAVPAVKLIRRRRRRQRLLTGDISAAWEDIVDRLTDLGAQPAASTTPTELAGAVDGAMTPLARVYGRSVYGPAGSISQRHIDTAIASLDRTTELLTTRYSAPQRIIALYRPATILPRWMRRTPRNGNGRGRANNGNGTR
jgi:transglutaminase-like putative cysteine protease